jgi:6-phosphogluconate dehydrogenase
MQLISEAYLAMRDELKLSNDAMASVFEEWNKGDLDSYLIEITAEILRKREENGQGFVLDKILDAAGQKGTGKWTAKVLLFLTFLGFCGFLSVVVVVRCLLLF